MDTITTTLKRQWFAEIVARKKSIEYWNLGHREGGSETRCSCTLGHS